MANFYSRRLEALLGCAPQDATVASIQSLIDAGASEDFDLDFKSELYSNGDSARRDLAGDVAALANTAGGLIVIGIVEDEQARATAPAPVPVSDDETRRMTQIIATLSPLPVVDIYPVSGAVAGEGYYLIAVPRSPLAPHAVPINSALRYPVRNISTTRYLSEPEVAAAYRRRALGAADRTSRAEQVLDDGVRRLDRSELPWICVTLVPEIPGDVAIDGGSLEAFRGRYVGRAPKFSSAAFYNVGVARGRFQLGGGHQVLSDKYVAADLHTDGAAFLGQQLGDITSGWSPRSAAQNHVVDDEDVVAMLIAALVFMGYFARDEAHAGGTVDARATLLTASEVNLEIGNSRGFGAGRSASSCALLHGTSLTPALASALLDDVAVPSVAALLVARELANQLGQTFGISELKQISTDGALRLPYWTGKAESNVAQWAQQAQLPLADQ